MLIRFESRDLDRFERHLGEVAKQAIPHGVRNGLNKIAFEARTEWQEQLGSRMVLRNNYTARSILVDKATGTNLETMRSVVGSVADYMGLQEDGGSVASKGKHGVTIPTPVSSGEGRGANPRKKLVRRPNRLSSIHLGSRLSTSNRKQRNAASIRQAIASGRKYAFLELERRKGLFRISGGKRKPKVDMVWDLTRKAVTLPKNATLEPTLSRISTRIPHHFAEAMVEQLRRRKVFGY
jgi:hypothetical protein